MMLSNDLILSDVAFLSSDKAIDELKKNDLLGKDFLKRLLAYVHDYQPYLHRNLRDEDVINQLYAYEYDKPNITINSVLSRLAHTFLDWQGSHFEVKPSKLELWLELLSLIDGTWVIAQAYKDIAIEYNFSSSDIINAVITEQCPHALANDSTKKLYADNHVHLGGHGHTGPSLLSFALYGATLPNMEWPKRPEYTLFESGQYKKADLPIWSFQLAGKLVECAFTHSENTAKIDLTNTKFEQPNFLALYYLNTQSATTLAQKVFLQAHCKPVRSDVRWLLFCIGVVSTELQNPAITAKFIRVSNVLRNYMIVWGTGLSQFVKSFGFSARKRRVHTHQNNSRLDGLVSDINNHIFREFRVATNVVVNDKGKIGIKNLKQGLEASFKHSLAENIHFVIHFSRSLKGDLEKREDKYQANIRKTLKQQVTALQKFKGSVTFSDTEIKAFGLNLSDKQSIDLRKAIRGYDLAGNENELPIEVFAPSLRVLRSAKHSTSSIFSKRFIRPFLTVHSGEDYSHLLSGLRAVDEAVYFCDFKNGDRLGHALALGVMPQVWACRQQTAYVSLGDHIDNLVWCYQKALEVIQTAPRFTGVLQLIQEKINFWSLQLYIDGQLNSENQQYSTRDMYEAWKLRRNCPETLNIDTLEEVLPNVDHLNPLYRDLIIDFDKQVGRSITPKAFKLWQKYVMGHIRNDKYFAARKKPVIVHCQPKQGEDPFYVKGVMQFDSVSAAELDLYEAIQDLQMEKYAAKGIIIEACPTSNIYIGRFEHYYEHPIFRWDPPEQEWLKYGEKYNRFGLRKGAITVCVNTDDAALMPTTIQNEHRVLQKAAIEHFNVGINKAEDWIERVRKKGVEIFKANHLDWVNGS
ncbi:MAG: antiviral RADAR system adenosine deaminase RdrB [Pseudomonadota bacterium]|nr:antiviral RADAR system adenosine deaminase RdrB [Pseudomonadota bacterium]